MPISSTLLSSDKVSSCSDKSAGKSRNTCELLLCGFYLLLRILLIQCDRVFNYLRSLTKYDWEFVWFSLDVELKSNDVSVAFSNKQTDETESPTRYVVIYEFIDPYLQRTRRHKSLCSNTQVCTCCYSIKKKTLFNVRIFVTTNR